MSSGRRHAVFFSSRKNRFAAKTSPQTSCLNPKGSLHDTFFFFAFPNSPIQSLSGNVFLLTLRSFWCAKQRLPMRRHSPLPLYHRCCPSRPSPPPTSPLHSLCRPASVEGKSATSAATTFVIFFSFPTFPFRFPFSLFWKCCPSSTLSDPTDRCDHSNASLVVKQSMQRKGKKQNVLPASSTDA